MTGNSLAVNSDYSIAGGFSAYLNYAYSQRPLSMTEERDLFARYAEHNDLDAARAIILSHLRFVAFVARSFSGYQLPLEDLVQEGSIGLMKAIKRFDLSFGVRFASFAVHWIKAEIQEYVIRNWKLVKVATTKAQRRLFFNLRGLKNTLGWMNANEIKEVANYLDVDESDVVEMESRLRQADVFFDPSFGEAKSDDSGLGEGQAKLLEDKSPCPEQHYLKEDLNKKCRQKITQYLATLAPRSRDIFVSRWLVNDESQRSQLKELAQRYNISPERVRQIESDVLNQLRQHLKKEKISLV
ncbi:RNA polymerase factor sigma-32 [Neiella sp. HB171785]|uniref:RNA polymerase factor sigma-32 n=1 Tax=Neiella litorisoli TaxID=2771431 RepID=A0A8J6UIR9_9GAMM|nr:RNA polymerase factor sigma-32 [Neiella litorisoli]MBD1388953.1 RNA polymerase factor sigma-32 [Neiella litorisoli]